MTRAFNRRAFTAAFVSGLACAATARAQPPEAQARRAAGAVRTYRYASAPGVAPDLQSLDLYAPPGQNRPLVVFIHGGGWRIGDKANPASGADKARFFNAQGFAYASLNYRLSPAVTHPAHVEDVAAGLAWLHDHAAEQGLDPGRIAVMGHSAGAHLAALVATDARRLGRHGKPLSILRGVVLLDGAGYNVVAEMAGQGRRPRNFLSDMYRDAFTTDPAVQRDASPVTHVARAQGIAPFLIVHTDRAAAVVQGRGLAERLGGAGVDARLFRAAGYSHADANHRIGEPGEAITGEIMAALARWGVTAARP